MRISNSHADPSVRIPQSDRPVVAACQQRAISATDTPLLLNTSHDERPPGQHLGNSCHQLQQWWRHLDGSNRSAPVLVSRQYRQTTPSCMVMLTHAQQQLPPPCSSQCHTRAQPSQLALAHLFSPTCVTPSSHSPRHCDSRTLPTAATTAR